MRDTVDRNPPPYKVKPPGSVGRTPTQPKDVVRFLLLRALFFWSYDSIFSLLCACPCLANALGFTKIPAPTTVQGLVSQIPERYVDMLIRDLSHRIKRKRWNTACDGSGISTKRYKRWFDVRYRGHVKKKEFIKMHGMIVTLARYPFFLSATVTAGTRHDSPELKPLLEKREKSIPLGNVTLDKAFCGRNNAQMIANENGTPIIDLKKNVTPKAKGYPAWNNMVWAKRMDGRAYKNQHRRRAVIEGVIGAFKARFGDHVRSKRRHAQRVEVLFRIVVMDAIAVAYHCK
jgi:hypothetical protein